MDDPDKLHNWSQKEKEEYAEMKINKMKQLNELIRNRHAIVEDDRRAAENRNSSVTNLNRSSSNSTGNSLSRKHNENRYENPEKPKVTFTREWDRGKEDGIDFDDTHSLRFFKNYSNEYDGRRINRSGSYHQRSDYNSFEKKPIRNEQHRYFNDGSTKQSRYQNSESSQKFQQSKEKFTKNSKKHNKHSSSSSSDYKFRENKTNEDSYPVKEWHSERKDEIDNKRERIQKWLQETKPTKETNAKITSPKRKLEKSGTASDKHNNEDELINVQCYQADSGQSKSREISSLKSRRLECRSTKPSSSGQNKIRQNNLSEEKEKQTVTKIHRMQQSAYKDSDSDSSYDEKLENLDLEVKKKNKEQITETDYPNNSSCYSKGSRFVRKSSDRSIAPTKVSSHKVGHNISKEYMHKNRGYNYVDNEKDKKKDYVSKQQSDEARNNSDNKSRNAKKKNYDCKNDNSWNVNDDGRDNTNYDDDGYWGNTEQSTNYDDDGYWGNAEQSDIEWKIKENENCVKKNQAIDRPKSTENKSRTKVYKAKDPTASDDGGWSTVEEGEIISDGDENKRHVK